MSRPVGSLLRGIAAFFVGLALLPGTALPHSPRGMGTGGGPEPVTDPVVGPRLGCDACTSCDPSGNAPPNTPPVPPPPEEGQCPEKQSSEDSSEGTGGASGEAGTASCGGSAEPGQGQAGDPVLLFTGALAHERTDMVVPGVFPIRIIRRYDNQSSYDSALGYGWSHNFDVRLHQYPDGSIIVRSRCGVRDEYVWNESAYEIADPERGPAPLLRPGANGGFELHYPTGILGFFDADGKLTALEDPRGNRLEMEYDPAGRLALSGISPYSVTSGVSTVAHLYQLKKVKEVLNADGDTGRAVHFEYAPNGRLTRIYTDGGREVTYSYDEPGVGYRGNLARVEYRTVDPALDPDGLENLVTEYRYEDADPHNLTSIRDGDSTDPVPVERAVMTYDAEDRVETQTFGQSVWTFDYSVALQTTVTRAVFDGIPSADPAVDREDAVTIFRFNSAGFLVEKTNALSHRFVYEREPDPQRPYLDKIHVYRWTGTAEILQKTIDLGYSIDGNLTTRSVTLSATGETVTETWEYTDGWVSAYQVASDAAPTWSFRTQLLFERGGWPPGDPNFSPSAPISNVHRIQHQLDDIPTFEETELRYDGNGQLVRIIPADGPEVVRTYYAPATQHAGLLHEITLEPGGTPDPHLKRTFAYDTHGFLDTIEDARGNVTDLSRDLLGRLTAIENAEEEVVELSYSAPTAGLPDPAAAPPGFFLSEIEIGRTVAEGEGQVRRLRWDARGRLLAFERKDDADTFSTFATFSYDSDGNRTGSTDATGRTVSLDYDLLGQLRLVTDDAGSDPDSCQATPSITS